MDRSGLTSYEAGFPLTYIDPLAPAAEAESSGAYRTDLLTLQERCTLTQYNAMESLAKLQRERELEEKRRRLNAQLSSFGARASPSGVSERRRRERTQTAQKHGGCVLRSRAPSPGEAVSAPERHPAPESVPERSFLSPAADSSPARWRQVFPPNRPAGSRGCSPVSLRSLHYSQPGACSPNGCQRAALQRARGRQGGAAGRSLLCSPVGQHSSDYAYVMNRLAPDIRYHSWRSRHPPSDASSTGPAPATPLSGRLADKGAASPAAQAQQRSRWDSPRRTLSPAPSVRPPRLDTGRRRASPGISPMHPVAQGLPEDGAGMLTVRAIDLSDLRLEDLTLAG